jgi:zinc protease
MQRRCVAPLPAPRFPTAVKEAIEQRDRKQTAMVIGFPSVPATSPEWPAFRLMQAVTSGLSGTFFAELRGRQSLAYTVQAGPITFAKEGAFRGYLAGEASKEDTARKALLAEMRKQDGAHRRGGGRANPSSPGRHASRARRTGARRDYGRNYILALPLDNTDRTLRIIPTLTAEDLRKAAQHYLGGDNYVYAAVRGKASENLP